MRMKKPASTEAGLISSYAELVDLEFGHLVPLGLAVNLEVDNIRGFYQVLRELFARALEVIALYVGYVFAIFVGFNQQEALGIFWVAVPLEFQAARLSVAGFGVPVDLIEESVSVFGLDMEFNVNENHGAHDTERILMRIPRRVSSKL